MKKKKFSIVTAIITLFMQIVCILQPTVAFAEEVGNNITNTTKFKVTNVEIKKDGNDTELGEEIKKDSEIFIKYYWEIPNSEDVKEGDYYTVKLPKQINIVSPIKKEINSVEGKVADMYIDTNGVVKLVFTKFTDIYSNIKGNFYVNCHFKASEIGTNNPVPIEFTIPGRSEPVVVDIDFEQEKPTITKSGHYDKTTDEITWNIIVNKENVTLNEVSIQDIIQDGQKFIDGSVTINGKPVNTSSYNYDEENKKFTYDMGNISKQQIITFKTSIHDDLATKGQGNYEYKNKTNLKYKDKQESKNIESNTANVQVQVNLINKWGQYNKDTKKIDWTITVNDSGRTIKNASFKDTLPKGLKLDESSIKVNSDNVLRENYTYLFEDYSKESVFNINLGDISTKTEVKFSTYVDPSVFNSNISITYKNTVELSGEGVKPGTSADGWAQVYSNIIQKRGIGYDASTGIITWQIVVNESAIDIGAGAVITDTIGEDQTYVDGSATINNSDKGAFTTLSDKKLFIHLMRRLMRST